jgi:hypothetical protein
MKKGLSPLSSAQRMFWFLDRFEPASPAYNVPRALKIEGELNISALREAFRALLHRHDVLRTRFVDLEGELFQEVVEDIDIDFTLRDLSGLLVAERKIETSRIAAEEASRPFDLEQPPLLRLSLVRLDPEEHILVLVMHHIVTDGWSMSNLSRRSLSPMASLRPVGGQKWRHCLSNMAILPAGRMSISQTRCCARISSIGGSVFADARTCCNYRAIARAQLFKAITVRSKALPSTKR